jgi:hypothetical protein
VQVPVERLVPDQAGDGHRLGEHRVHDLGGVVAVAGEQLTQHRPECPERIELLGVEVASPGVPELGEPLVELLDRRHRVRWQLAVDEHHGGVEGELRVMGEDHVDILPTAS